MSNVFWRPIMARPKRRIARYISRVDRERIEHGEVPSWEEAKYQRTVVDTRKRKGTHHSDVHPDDRRLLEDLPPHWKEGNQ